MAGAAVNSNQSYQLLLTSYQAALLNNLPERCLILTQLLQDSSVKELQYIYPALVEHMFGFRSGIDWGLLSLDKEFQIREFEAVKKFLMPDGPVLKLAYKFIEDFSPKFEFPLSHIPLPSQLMLQEGKVPAIYANKLQIVNPGLFPSTVQLNAFEFFFFHFAYVIVNPSLKNSQANVNQQNTLYAYLLEDYLCNFLPTDGRAVPMFQPSHIQHSPILTSSLSSSFGNPHLKSDSMLNTSFTRPDCLTPMRQKPSLLKKNTVMMVSSPSSSSCAFGSSQAECWRSETFLLILKEMYLNQNSFDHQQSILDLTTVNKTFIPSHYHVYMVRILVKHLHFFFNSTLYSSNLSGHGQIMIDTLGRLKSLGMTQLIQKEIYCFLKSAFDHWPLDASFRVPLETWLSYIQPWRYVQCNVNLDLSLWQKFVNENALFYTLLFQQVIKRFLRMDFNCPQNAYMLFRVTKVFATDGIRDMIVQAEKLCVSKPSTLGMTSSYSHRSPEKSFSFRKVSHLEGIGNNYVQLFSEPVFLMVMHLLSSISTALEKLNYCGINQSSKNRSFFSHIYSIFDMSDEAYNSDDNSPADIEKMSMYLNTSINQLHSFFREVALPIKNTMPPLLNETSDLSHMCNEAGDGPVTGPQKLNDMHELMKKKKFNITYQGNPDLQPVRTYEIATLVRFFNKLSQELNEKYESDVQGLYHQQTLLGKVCRKVLAKPLTYYDVIKSKDMLSVSRNAVYLPPRIYLRFLANKQLIMYFILVLLFAYWFGCNPVFTVIILFFLITLLVFVSAILYPVPIETKRE